MFKFKPASACLRQLRLQQSSTRRLFQTSQIFLNQLISNIEPNEIKPPTPPVEESSGKSSRWRKYIPMLTLLGAGSWGLYTFSYLFIDEDPSEYMTPYTFTPFIITNKLDIDNDHYLIELTPKFNKWRQTKPEIWNGHKLWSVEIKQPQIMVVRKYTPLPLLIDNDPTTSTPSHVRIQSEQDYNEGKLTLYIKKYAQGEVARWIGRKSIGSELELRGPFIEYEFPSDFNTKEVIRPPVHNVSSHNKPDPLEKFKVVPSNVAFFSAGTGIAPVLQSLLSSNSPLDHVRLYHSRRTETEVKPFESILHLLQSLGRLDMVSFVNPHKLTVKDIPTKQNSKLISMDEKISQYLKNQKSPYDEKILKMKFDDGITQAQTFQKLGIKINDEQISKIIICGTDGFIRDIAGVKPYEGQGQLGGWLKSKGWDQDDVFKM
ncbi:hypothetical protein WICPIJ_006322 [Wickerhamomyces pijperi]|uniref:FAD-binding FR-type domain-containing protein n=1 Tax=Wickerhamomyces pijperi TaxID=599730 RepID=A0A9P8TLI2_WICPI|nr:hypothetical protein WICPIJ_006322 [Wickerhamomyces pijperi]